MLITESKRKSTNSAPKDVVDERIKKARKEHEKLVKGRFEFIDAQGGWIDFTYRFFPGDPVMTIHLNHGETCELPMGIVKHLNNTVKKVRKFNVDDLKDIKRGMPGTYEVQSRLRFTPVDFI